MAGQVEITYAVLRRSPRIKVAKPLRVRPAEARDGSFEDVPVSVNASKQGIFFTSQRTTYYPGMRVYVIFPYTSPEDKKNAEYLAEVKRVENMPDGDAGVAVHLLMSV
jgi:PilZ domain-containing protein